MLRVPGPTTRGGSCPRLRLGLRELLAGRLGRGLCRVPSVLGLDHIECRVDAIRDASRFIARVPQPAEPLHPRRFARSDITRGPGELFLQGLGDELLERLPCGSLPSSFACCVSISACLRALLPQTEVPKLHNISPVTPAPLAPASMAGRRLHGGRTQGLRRPPRARESRRLPRLVDTARSAATSPTC